MAYYGGQYGMYGNGMYGGNMMMNHSLMNGVMNGTFFFNGEPTLLETRINDIPEQKINEVKQAQLMISGNLVKQYNTFCVICTIIWGSIVIFPLCFMCCDWWKKIAYPIYDVNYQAYGSLDRLLRCPNLQHLRFQVTDNLFNDSKAQALYDSISRSSLRSFHFLNMAMDYDVQADEYSRFKQRMSPFKKLNMVTQIRWQWDVVL